MNVWIHQWASYILSFHQKCICLFFRQRFCLRVQVVYYYHHYHHHHHHHAVAQMRLLDASNVTSGTHKDHHHHHHQTAAHRYWAIIDPWKLYFTIYFILYIYIFFNTLYPFWENWSALEQLQEQHCPVQQEHAGSFCVFIIHQTLT